MFPSNLHGHYSPEWFKSVYFPHSHYNQWCHAPSPFKLSGSTSKKPYQVNALSHAVADVKTPPPNVLKKRNRSLNRPYVSTFLPKPLLRLICHVPMRKPVTTPYTQSARHENGGRYPPAGPFSLTTTNSVVLLHPRRLIPSGMGIEPRHSNRLYCVLKSRMAQWPR